MFYAHTIVQFVPFINNPSFLLLIYFILLCYSFVILFILFEIRKFKDEYVLLKKSLKNLKNFLKDFSKFKSEKIKEVKLYDDYFIFALVFGIADNAEKELEQHHIDSNISKFFVTLRLEVFFDVY